MWGSGKLARGMAWAGACMPVETSTRATGTMTRAMGMEAAYMLVETSTRVRDASILRLTDSPSLPAAVYSQREFGTHNF